MVDGVAFFWLRLRLRILLVTVFGTFCGAGSGSAIHDSKGTVDSTGTDGSVGAVDLMGTFGDDESDEHESDDPDEDEDDRLIKGGKSDRDEEECEDDDDKFDDAALLDISLFAFLTFFVLVLVVAGVEDCGVVEALYASVVAPLAVSHMWQLM